MNRQQEIQKAREIDTKLAEMYDEYYKVVDQMTRIFNRIENAKKYMERDIRLDLQIRAARYRDEIADLEAKIEELRLAAKQLQDAAVQFDKDNYTGWQRFFLVQHIHNTRYCSSFRPTTRVGWLPSVSGLTESEAVAEHGATLCTICFPSAPVELTVKPVDPNTCEGSGKGYSREHKTGREHSYYGAAGYCSVCLRWQPVTKSGVMRKHKKDDETRRHALDKR